MTKLKVNQLVQRGCTHIILHLFEHNTAMISELVKNLDITQDPIYKALPILKSLGLIEETHEKKFPRRRTSTLTEKGKKIAGKLTDIEAILVSE